MKPIIHLAWMATLASLPNSASGADYIFGQIHGKPGEKIRMISHIECPEGTIQRSVGGTNSQGTVSITRDSELIWTFRQAEADGTRRGMVRIPNVSNTVITKIDGKVDNVTSPSPLCGKLIEMSKPPQGDWKFDLDRSIPYHRVEDEMESMGSYLKRKWYPDYRIKLGDSWEFDPVWLKTLISKDLKKAKAIGTMRLRQVRHAASGQTALIDVTIRSSGGDFKADGTETDASLELDGSLMVNLETMLEESLDLKGTVTTTVSTAVNSSTTKLPLTIKVTKTFLR